MDPKLPTQASYWPIFKHLKIVYAQSSMPKVCANTCKIQHFFCLDLKANNPQNLLGCKPNIQKLNLMHFTPPIRLLALYFVTFLTVK
jgi:hypothetical protein